MPFDGIHNTPKQNRMLLAAALRSDMPENFTWGFRNYRIEHDCGTVGCALGLAVEIGLLRHVAINHRYDELKKVFGPVAIKSEFWNPIPYARDWDAVTPHMVADLLEKLED